MAHLISAGDRGLSGSRGSSSVGTTSKTAKVEEVGLASSKKSVDEGGGVEDDEESGENSVGSDDGLVSLGDDGTFDRIARTFTDEPVTTALEPVAGSNISNGTHTSKPKHPHQEIQGQDGENIVNDLDSWQHAARDDVCQSDEIENSGNDGKVELVDGDIMDHNTSKDQAKEADEKLENPEDEHPQLGGHHVGRM